MAWIDCKRRVLEVLSNNKAALAGGLLAVLGVVLVSSETSFKQLISQWLDACTIVVDIGKGRKAGEKISIPVTVHILGDAPDSFTVNFSSGVVPLIKNVQLERPWTSKNLAMHPMAGKECPPLDKEEGCDYSPPGHNTDRSDVHFTLSSTNRIFELHFAVHISATPDPLTDLPIYVNVSYPEPILRNQIHLCRVERASIGNFYVWAGDFVRIMLAAGTLFVLSVLVIKLRKWLKE